MRIAQVSPMYESVPPRLYGGTERVVSYLTEELVRQGHDVTLYASGDSSTSAKLRAICDKSLRLKGGAAVGGLAHHLYLLEKVVQEADDFDIIHFHLDYLPFSLIRRHDLPAVTTLHGRLDIPDLQPLFREFGDMNLISISDAQRAPMPWASWLQTVHHGLPADLYTANDQPGDYLAFLGRISPEKRVDRAITIAKRVGIPLRIAAKVDVVDREYFDCTIRPLLDDPIVEFIGEIDESEKGGFLRNARALLFPIDWPEPFGLVMIEAMACGTPVVAFRGGSVVEVIENGITGFVVDSTDEAVCAIENINMIDRRLCRRAFERRFSAHRMCEDYLRAYERVIECATRTAEGELGLSLTGLIEGAGYHAVIDEQAHRRRY
jgi:glycosyltransferase involved in cell wall biosynthesis